jgi:hypothetical protein
MMPRIQFLLSRPVLKSATQKLFALSRNRARCHSAVILQTAARCRRCRHIVQRLKRLRDDAFSASAGEFRPSPEMIAACVVLQRVYRGHAKGRRARGVVCQWRCGAASTWSLKSLCCMFAILSKRFFTVTKCRSQQLKNQSFRPMFPNYAQKFGSRTWRPSGRTERWFLDSTAAEEQRQQQVVEAVGASAAFYCRCSGGDGGYSHRVSMWHLFTPHTSSLLATSCHNERGGVLSNAAVHWLQIHSVRLLRMSAAEFFAAPKHLRRQILRVQPKDRRTVRLWRQDGSCTLNFLCAGVLVQAVVRKSIFLH